MAEAVWRHGGEQPFRALPCPSNRVAGIVWNAFYCTLSQSSLAEVGRNWRIISLLMEAREATNARVAMTLTMLTRRAMQELGVPLCAHSESDEIVKLADWQLASNIRKLLDKVFVPDQSKSKKKKRKKSNTAHVALIRAAKRALSLVLRPLLLEWERLETEISFMPLLVFTFIYFSPFHPLPHYILALIHIRSPTLRVLQVALQAFTMGR